MTNPAEQHVAERAGAIIDFLTKAAGLAAIFAGFLKWAWKPYVEWRRRRLAELMKELLGNELKSLRALIEREDGCADRMDLAVEQIRQLFDEHDMLTKVVFENRDRLDEMAHLLDTMGMDNDRRSPERLSEMLDQLEERRNARRRRLPIREDSDAPIRDREP